MRNYIYGEATAMHVNGLGAALVQNYAHRKISAGSPLRELWEQSALCGREPPGFIHGESSGTIFGSLLYRYLRSIDLRIGTEDQKNELRHNVRKRVAFIIIGCLLLTVLCACSSAPPKDTGLTKEAHYGELTYWVSPDWTAEDMNNISGNDGIVYMYLSGGETCAIVIRSADASLVDGATADEKVQALLASMPMYSLGLPLTKHDNGAWSALQPNEDGTGCVWVYPGSQQIYVVLTNIPTGNAEAQNVWDTFIQYAKVS